MALSNVFEPQKLRPSCAIFSGETWFGIFVDLNKVLAIFQSQKGPGPPTSKGYQPRLLKTLLISA